MGSASLSKVTVIAPRTDYQDVVRRLAVFEQFHPTEDREPDFDPAVQNLAVRAVGLFAIADEAVKDLSIPAGPGTLDVIFRGVKVPRQDVDARDWDDLLTKAEAQLAPIYERVKESKAALQTAVKEESDARGLRDALSAVSSLSVDVKALEKTQRVRMVMAVVESDKLKELGESLSDVIFLTQALSADQSLVLIASPVSEAARVAKAMKAFEVKPLSIPERLPQNPAEAYLELEKEYEAATRRREEAEAGLAELRKANESQLLAIREISETARNTLDVVRTAGKLGRIATISGYIPARLDGQFRQAFGEWIVYSEPAAGHGEEAKQVPTLMENVGPFKHFEIVTREQGTPGGHEVDPTPLISFVFPIFFGVMFGDLGHGLVLSAFALLLRARGTGSIRQWGNIFLAAGVAASVVGVIVGEFFGFPLYETLHIPGAALLEIVQRPVGGQATLDLGGLYVALEIALLIGIAHITTGLSLDVVQALKAHEKVEVLTEKIPALTMYLSGVGFGLSFIGAGFSFDVLKGTAKAPLLGVPNSILGAVSLAVVLLSMFGILAGKGIAIITGKSHDGSAAGAFGNGAIEVFERISSYLANTISYVRLAIMLMIHAALLLAVNRLLAFPLYIAVGPVIIFNILIIVFEVVIVYIQDLRLHIYEFFTKFYQGSGTPFRKLLPDGVRVKIRWR